MIKQKNYYNYDREKIRTNEKAVEGGCGNAKHQQS